MSQTLPTALRAVALLAGVCLGVPTSPAVQASSLTNKVVLASATSSPTATSNASVALSEGCLAETLCRLKRAVRWKTPAWSPATCQRMARAVLASAEKHRLSPALILAVMLNESDLDEKAATSYFRKGVLYAKDSGLMGIRCVLDRGRCRNGHVRGMRARDVADPVTNIELGARELAYDRDRGGVERRQVRERSSGGQLVTRTKLVRCRHQSHAYWAHYNHGSFYLSKGHARHYPHRVAVLYYALGRTLGLPVDEVTSRPVTIRDQGLRPRTADRPVEPRYRVLASKIYQTAPSCRLHSDTVLASLPGTP